MCVTWALTVGTLMNKASAIARLDPPAASRRRTSRSRAVNAAAAPSPLGWSRGAGSAGGDTAKA